ncbi:MAG: EAL domain-containing protein [Candidatus Nanopelagicales bacterium]
MSVAVNLAVTQLEDRALAEQLQRWPAPAGLTGLTVEVYESVFLPGRDRALELLKLMRRLGAQISVDDYGAGLSNLLLLKSLAPDFIKLGESWTAQPPTAHTTSDDLPAT